MSPGIYYGGPGDSLAIYAYSFSGTLGWRRLETSGPGPPKPNGDPITVIDPAERRLVLIYEQVWALALDGPRTWTRLLPTGRAPGLSGVAAALDVSHRRVLLNGGGTFGAPFLSSTWALNLSGSTHWDSLHVSPIPSPRRDHAAVYDSRRNRLVVAGGYGGTELLDAWALDLASGSWSSVGASVPQVSKRYNASAFYDPLGDAMVMFGGSDWSNYIVETARLSFDPPNWVVDPPTAEPLHHASMVYDDTLRRMLLFGGLGPTQNARAQLFSLDLTVVPPRWAKIIVNGEQPVRRHSHMAAWDPVRHRMFVFGGRVDETLLNDLWFYSENPTPQWTRIAPTGPVPSPRSEGALAYDPPRDRLVLMGGRADVLDAWELPLTGPAALQWRMLAPSGPTPPARHSLGVQYDPVRDRMLVVGGLTPNGGPLDSHTLAFDVTGDGTWANLASRPGQHYSTVTMIRADSLVVYDVQYANTPFETQYLPLAASQAWGHVEVEYAPPRRVDHCGAYDSHDDRLVVFGGWIDPDSDYYRRWLGDTWVLSWFDNATVDVERSTEPDQLALGPPTPNPANGQISVAFTRPRAGVGSLEVVDINGRRVVWRSLDGALTRGNAVIHLDSRLTPGVYFLRLVVDARCVTRRFSIVR